MASNISLFSACEAASNSRLKESRRLKCALWTRYGPSEATFDDSVPTKERMTGMTTDVLETAAAQGSLILAEGARRYIEYSSLVAALTAIANGHGSYSRDLADEFKPGQYGSPVRNPMEVYNDGRRFTGSQLDDIVAWVIQKRGSKKGEPLIPKTVPGRKKANGNGTDVDKTSTWLNATRFCHGLVDEIRRNRSVDERNKAQRIIDHYASLVNQNDGHLLAAVSGLIDDTHGAPRMSAHAKLSGQDAIQVLSETPLFVATSFDPSQVTTNYTDKVVRTVLKKRQDNTTLTANVGTLIDFFNSLIASAGANKVGTRKRTAATAFARPNRSKGSRARRRGSARDSRRKSSAGSGSSQPKKVVTRSGRHISRPARQRDSDDEYDGGRGQAHSAYRRSAVTSNTTATIPPPGSYHHHRHHHHTAVIPGAAVYDGRPGSPIGHAPSPYRRDGSDDDDSTTDDLNDRYSHRSPKRFKRDHHRRHSTDPLAPTAFGSKSDQVIPGSPGGNEWASTTATASPHDFETYAAELLDSLPEATRAARDRVARNNAKAVPVLPPVPSPGISVKFVTGGGPKAMNMNSIVHVNNTYHMINTNTTPSSSAAVVPSGSDLSSMHGHHLSSPAALPTLDILGLGDILVSPHDYYTATDDDASTLSAVTPVANLPRTGYALLNAPVGPTTFDHVGALY